MAVVGRQFRAARSLLWLDRHTVASLSGVSIKSLSLIEGEDADADAEDSEALRAWYAAKGVQFLEAKYLEGLGPGVRIAMDYADWPTKVFRQLAQLEPGESADALAEEARELVRMLDGTQKP